ncbi:Ca2+:H+ antiporter, partial [Phenoliferia sp. Uapishka_3]
AQAPSSEPAAAHEPPPSSSSTSTIPASDEQTSLQSSLGRGVPPPAANPRSMTSAPPPSSSQPSTTFSSPARRTTSSILQNPLPLVNTTRISSYAARPDNESIYSEDDGTDFSDAGRPPRASSSARGSSVVGGESTGGSGLKGKGLAVRSASQNPRSRSRARISRVVDDDDDDPSEGAMRRTMSPVGGRSMNPPPLDEDDEVERRDRGEELVRQRMKDRARLKKEAEKASKKRESDARAARLHRASSYAPTTPGLDQDPAFPTDRSVSGASSATYAADRPPGGNHPSPRSRDASVLRPVHSREQSRSGLRDSVASNATEIAGYSTDTGRDTIRPGGLSTSTSPAASDAWPHSPATFNRGTSYASSVRNDDEDDSGFTDRPLSRAGHESIRASEVEDAEEEEEGDMEDGSDDEDMEDQGEVEYTLKDRQDAINIEHPFGLPIWKPALYKKSRSVTRNAETALHSIPSSTALRHLAPGNLLWTLFFGSWLLVICGIVSGVLWCVPWGGEKYGRVIWELGGYLFWPFGKYVQGWSDGDEDDEEVAEDEENEGEEEDDIEQHAQALHQPHDVEEAGRTFSRGRGTSTRPTSRIDHLWEQPEPDSNLPDEPRRTNTVSQAYSDRSTTPTGTTERAPLLPVSTSTPHPGYGTPTEDKAARSASEDTIAVAQRPHDFTKDDDGHHAFRVRALGRSMYWVAFYLVIAPLMLIVCILCWAMVFTIPMAKLLWVLIRHLNNEPLALHFRSPPKYASDPSTDSADAQEEVVYPLRAGQRAPPVSRQSVRDAKAHGRLFGPRSTVLLCTYRAAGLQYYKYTIDGVNILFINLLSLVFFTIADFMFIAPWVEKHEVGGILGALAGHGAIFILALLSVIPLSYFIGMAVASISAQSSIGMGAVINASFGSIIEIILYCIALTQSKADLVEGSIVGSFLAGVLLMPGLSMIGGAMRRKEQKFNAKSAGVTSTMLIMAIIGILTPTLFYEIYGSFQLTCTGCDPSGGGTTTSCRTCYYEHVDPVDDPFYKTSVRLLSFWCAGILVLSYLIGLWFSLRTHASQIWQNNQSSHEQALVRPLTAHIPNDRNSLYKRVLPSHLLPKQNRDSTVPLTIPALPRRFSKSDTIPGIELPQGLTADELSRAFHVVNAVRSQSQPRQVSHAREVSKADEEDGHGGHDAPNWSRVKSASVLMGCTALYAIIAEILVDMVDVVLDGSGIPEKFLGVTLFALVPNTTEFMNAISFAINGNIALSLEIGSAYALQVCLIQAPVMLAFSAFYGIGKESLLHQSFTLVFPRWDVIAIIFSVFLLTYTYLEARANYYKGSILCLSYLVLIGGFAFAPAPQAELPAPGSFGPAGVPSLGGGELVKALFNTLFSH